MNRSRITNVIAFLALFACLAGTATAAKLISGKNIKNNSVAGKDIKNKSVTGKDVKNGSLGAADLSKKAKASLSGGAGTAGPAGKQGPIGPVGPAGPAVAPNVFTTSVASKALPMNVETLVLQKAVPNGTYAVTAKLVLFQGAADNGDCSLLAGGELIDGVSIIPANANARTPITLTGVAPAGAASPIRVTCLVDDAAGSAGTVKIVAIPVGSVG